MSFTKAAHSLERIGNRISTVLNRVGTALILVMMLGTTTDVVLRYIFNRPIKGAFEITELLMLTVVALGLAYTQTRKGHVFVELVSRRFSPRGQAVNDAAVYLVSLGICLLIAWRVVTAARVTQVTNMVASPVVEVPIYPFYYLMGFGIAVLCLVYIIDILNSVLRAVKK